MGLLRKINRSIRSLISLNRARELAVLTRMMQLSKVHRLLDVGCGDGYWSARLAAQAGEVTAIDPSEELLDAARSHYHKSNLRFIAASAESIPLPDSSFDRVVAVSVVEHFGDPVKGLHEMSRVLRPGGILAISVDSLTDANSREQFRRWHSRKHFVHTYFERTELVTILRNCGLVPDQEGIDGIFSSRMAASLRGLFIRNPRLLLPLFPFFLALCRLADHWSLGGKMPAQVLIVKSLKPGEDSPRPGNDSEAVRSSRQEET